MGAKWKNRLVGSLVLFALGIIFVPLFLSPAKDLATDGAFVSSELAGLQEDSVVTEPEVTPSDTPSARHGDSISTEAPSSPKIELFALQIGSYDDHENAKRQVAILKKSGFPAFIRIEGNTKQVLVGPQTGIAHVQEVRLKLRTSLNYRTIVVTYDPKEGDYP
jgi:cell division septation protein DedD